jgi:hypothetical protein
MILTALQVVQGMQQLCCCSEIGRNKLTSRNGMMTYQMARRVHAWVVSRDGFSYRQFPDVLLASEDTIDDWLKPHAPIIRRTRRGRCRQRFNGQALKHRSQEAVGRSCLCDGACYCHPPVCSHGLDGTSSLMGAVSDVSSRRRVLRSSRSALHPRNKSYTRPDAWLAVVRLRTIFTTPKGRRQTC